MKRWIPIVFAVIAAGARAADGDSHLPAPVGLRAGLNQHERNLAAEGWAGRAHRHLRDVALSEAQEDKLFAIGHALAPQQREHEREARKAHVALLALADSGQFDEARAASLAQAEGNAVAALALLRARADAQALAVLTPEQRKQRQVGEHDAARRDQRQ